MNGYDLLIENATVLTMDAESTVLRDHSIGIKDGAVSFLGEQAPEPPKDENGNPIAPPEGCRPPMGFGGHRPEPPKDENGNPIAPPDGAFPGKPEETAAAPENSETV